MVLPGFRSPNSPRPPNRDQINRAQRKGDRCCRIFWIPRERRFTRPVQGRTVARRRRNRSRSRHFPRQTTLPVRKPGACRSINPARQPNRNPPSATPAPPRHCQDFRPQLKSLPKLRFSWPSGRPWSPVSGPKATGYPVEGLPRETRPRSSRSPQQSCEQHIVSGKTVRC